MEPQSLSVSQLLVNHHNPRFEPVKNQSEAIELMLEEAGDDVLRLAKDIAQSRVNPTRSLMVVKAGEKYLVLDGNRRVTALKLLHRPGLTKNVRFKEKFAELKRNAGAKVQEEVNCVVFPDRESAFRWVKLEHTGKNKGVGTVKWDAKQGQRFLAQFIGEKPSRSLQLFDYAEARNISHDEVDSSTLNRLLATKTIRELIGVDFPDYVLNRTVSDSKLLDNIRKVFAAMSHSDFKVSDVYTATKAKDWIEGILGISPESDEESKDQGAKKGGTEPGTRPKPKPKPKARPLEGDWITPALYKAYSLDNRVKAVLGELKSGLKPAAKPNVCATSLRVLLELAVYVFLTEKGHIKTLRAEEKQRRVDDAQKKGKKIKPLEKDWSPSFHKMLTHMASDESLIPDPLDGKALKVFTGPKGSKPFFAELNQFMHNPSYNPTPDMVIAVWKNLGKLVFKAILEAQDADTN